MALRLPLDSPELTLSPAFTADDLFGDPYEHPAEERVRWDVGMGCFVSFDHQVGADQPVSVTIATGVDFPKSGRDQRAVTTEQIRRYACLLIAFAEHVDRSAGAS